MVLSYQTLFKTIKQQLKTIKQYLKALNSIKHYLKTDKK